MTNSINLTDMGNRIKLLRLKQRKTQEYFADMLFISPSYLALIESGKRTATIDVLAQIAKVCDVSVDYLLFGISDYTNSQVHRKLDRLINMYSNEQIEKALQLAEYYLQLDSSTISE